MSIRTRTPITWAANASLSSWVSFGAGAPNCLILPASMDGVRLAFVGAETGANGEADPSTAVDLYDVTGGRVAPAVVAAGGRIIFAPDALRNQGWIALRSIDAAGAAVVQTNARAGAWLYPFPG